MSALREGIDILWAAIASLRARPMTAVRLYLVVAAGMAIIDLVDLYALHEGEDGLSSFIWAILSVLLTAILAVGWHRAVLCPGEGRPELWRWVKYGLAWIVNGIVFMILLFPFSGILVLLQWGLSRLLRYGPQGLQVVSWDEILTSPLLLFEPAWTLPIYAVLGAAFLWLLYRLALGLPSIAIDRGDLRYRESWRRTKPLARPIIGLAAIAGLAQTPALLLPYLSFWIWPDAPLLAPVSLATTIVGSFLYVAVILVGAAILTELYRLTEPLEGTAQTSPHNGV